jgi:hypothetical protein
MGALPLWRAFFHVIIIIIIIIIYQAVLRPNVDFLSSVDCSGRGEDPCGISWTGETPQELATRRLTASPAESEAPGTEINSQV